MARWDMDDDYDPDYDPEKDVNTWLQREGLKWAPKAGVWDTDPPEPGLDLTEPFDPVIGDAQIADGWLKRAQNRWKYETGDLTKDQFDEIRAARDVGRA